MATRGHQLLRAERRVLHDLIQVAQKVVKIRRNSKVAPMIEAGDENASCGP